MTVAPTCSAQEYKYIKHLARLAGCYPQAYGQSLWIKLSRVAQGLQTSVPFEFNNLVVGARPPVVRIIGTRQVFCGEYRGENRSQSISKGSLLKLGAADHDRVVNDGTGLSGRVHAGAKGISVRYRYRFEGESREMPLGAWPRVALAAIRLKLDETKLRVQRGGDPASAGWSRTS
ncbi:Arm DNA-binding domain-containing protein [Paraburkholderia sp. D1E]|uniref:Arm DNA-binding domain-containing protein n=1 Tax=Paraburkholderia sp. D1E TaxID=3461398 RepID=UPI004046379E